MTDKTCAGCEPCPAKPKSTRPPKPEVICVVDEHGCILHPVIKTIITDTDPITVVLTHMGNVIDPTLKEVKCPEITMTVSSGCNPDGGGTTEPPTGGGIMAFPLPDKCVEVTNALLETEVMYATPVVTIGAGGVPSITHYLDPDGDLITDLVIVLPDCDCINCDTCT